MSLYYFFLVFFSLYSGLFIRLHALLSVEINFVTLTNLKKEEEIEQLRNFVFSTNPILILLTYRAYSFVIYY